MECRKKVRVASSNTTCLLNNSPPPRHATLSGWGRNLEHGTPFATFQIVATGVAQLQLGLYCFALCTQTRTTRSNPMDERRAGAE